MTPGKRKVSPRAPSLPLDEAIKRAIRMYEAEGSVATSTEVALQHFGYSGKNGAALQTMASIGYWGLIERTRDGIVRVAKVVEDYRYTPDESHKQDLLIRFLRNPPVFAGLLDKYKDRLPSDGTLQYDMIQLGFTPGAAASCLSVFKRSVEFANYYSRPRSTLEEGRDEVAAGSDDVSNFSTDVEAEGDRTGASGSATVPGNRDALLMGLQEPGVDRIPIRLAGGRRAWLEIPSPFFNADRERLKKHIDLLLTEDEDDGVEFDSSHRKP
jgi:hypothetical protein